MAPMPYWRIGGMTRSNSRCSVSASKNAFSTLIALPFVSKNSLARIALAFLSLFILYTFVGTSEALFAQTVNDPRWRNFKQDDGLTTNDIWSILVDDNVVWFGESDSISRFDGTWLSYSSESTDTSLTASDGPRSGTPSAISKRQTFNLQGDVAALERSVNGNQIWIGTRSGQLSIFDSSLSVWVEVAQLKTGIWDITIADSYVWIGADDGLYRTAHNVEIHSGGLATGELATGGLATGETATGESADESTNGAFMENGLPLQIDLVAADDSYANEPHLTQPIYELFGAADSLLGNSLPDDSIYVGGALGLHQLTADGWNAVALPTASAFLNPGQGWCANTANQPSAEDQPLSVHAVWIDPQNGLWVGTAYGAARRNDADCWTLIPTYTSEGTPALVQELVGGDEGSVWAVTDGGGALLFEEYGAVTLAFGRDVPGNLNTNFIRSVAIDQDGAVWFATPVGVFQYLNRTWYLEPGYAETVGLTIGEPDAHDIRDMLIDEAGLLWIATGAGVRVKDSPTLERPRFTTESSNLPGNNIFSLTQDRDGGIWAGTDGAGVARFSNGEWSTPIAMDLLPSPGVPKLAADVNGIVWLGTDLGLVAYSLDTGTVTYVEELAGETIKSLELDSANRLWVASALRASSGQQNATISRLSLSDGGVELQQESLQNVFPEREEELPYEFELSLAADYRFPGGMWLAIDQVGLYYWDGSTWNNGDPARELPTDFLWTLYTTPESNDLWVGNEGGVSRFDGRTWGTLKDVDGLASPAIWAIAGTHEAGLWFGGRSGLSYYRPDSTPPWVRIQDVSGEVNRVDANGFLSIGAGESLDLSAITGDLQTPQNKLELYYRRVPLLENGEADLTNVEWIEFSGVLPLATELLGNSRIELQARDLAFNYSEILAIPVAIVPTNMVDLTAVGLGKVELNTFLTLIALSILAILGFGYVSLEIVQSRKRAIEAMVRSYNPYVSGEPIRRDDMFFGRHNLLQRIINTLHNNSIMLHGERRIGKTTMLYQIASRLTEVDDAHYWFVPIYVDLEGTPQERFFHFLMEEIIHQVHRGYDWAADEGEDEDEEASTNEDATLDAEADAFVSHRHGPYADDTDPSVGQLREATYYQPVSSDLNSLLFYSVDEEAYTDREFNRDLRKVVHYLKAYGEEYHADKKLRMILMMDEMDVMSSYDHLVQQQLRRIFMRDFASTMGAVVAGIQISQDWDRIESPWYNMFNEIEVEPFTDEQGIELLVEPVKDYYTYEQDALDFIIEHSDGRPFRIQQYGLEVVTSMLAAGRRRIKLEDVLIAHQNIQNSYTSTHSLDGLFPNQQSSHGSGFARSIGSTKAAAEAFNQVSTQPTPAQPSAQQVTQQTNEQEPMSHHTRKDKIAL